MPEPRYALGVDYGTQSVRALIVDVDTGEEVGTASWNYSTGVNGVWIDPSDPHLARQNPQDYMDGFIASVSEAVRESGVDPKSIVGIGIDTTGSTPLPVDAEGWPLALGEFKGNLHAMAWLWKDHTAHAEAAEITALAENRSEPYLAKCGGTYSSEWLWSKILRCTRVAPDVAAAAHSWVEVQDWIPGWITGNLRNDRLKRGVCAAGHKGMYHPSWGGLPSEDFLNLLDPRLGALRKRMFDHAYTVDQQAGVLTEEIASQTGLVERTPVAVGAFDAHLGAVGSGVKPGSLVKIMGTSTCDIMVGGADTPDIPGVCGIVPGSVLPGLMGIEAGQSAVGDLFEWCSSKLGTASHESLTEEALKLKPGESGLLALDWNNGNRTVLVDPLLSGLIVGQSLHTTQAHIYRALIEATAFGARKIIERIAEYGVDIEEIIACGGIASKSPLVMQIYADVCNRPIKISRSDQTCALGAAMCGAVVGGAHPDFASATAAMTGVRDRVFSPNPEAARVYDRLYYLYSQLHDGFGVAGTMSDFSGVMKELLEIRKS